nr:Transposase [Klebsiella pneumoniae]
MGAVHGLMKINYGAFCFLPHNTVTNHLHVMRQKASSATSIIPGRCYFLPGISTLYAA